MDLKKTRFNEVAVSSSWQSGANLTTGLERWTQQRECFIVLPPHSLSSWQTWTHWTVWRPMGRSGSWRLLPPDLCESLRKHPCLGWPWDTLFTPPRRVLEARAVYFSLRRLNKDITDSLQYYLLFPREALSTIIILTPK